MGGRGGGEGRGGGTWGAFNFFGGNMGMGGGLKRQKMTLGGVFKFLLNIKGPDFDSVLRKVLYCVILKQFHQHFNKEI